MSGRVLVRFVFVAGAFLGVAGRALATGPVVGPGAIALSVRDVNGQPISGAVIVADGPTLRRSITGSAGIATLQALPLGVYDVQITRAGYESYVRQVAIARGAPVPTILDLRVAVASFANVQDVASALATPALGAGGDPIVAHALTAAPGVEIVPVSHGAGSALALAGTNGGEARVELDGIPVAGGSAAFAALRFRSALSLDDVELVPPPASRTATVRDAIGGIVDYRTPAIQQSGGGELELGYDSEFGAFQHARFTRTFGRLGILTDAVTGGGENRSQTVKARYRLSGATSLGFAGYGSQSAANIAGVAVANTAPAYAADLRTSLGRGIFTARRFASASRTSSEPPGSSGLREDARVAGLQVGYDVPLGRQLISLAFDRRSELEPRETLSLRRTFTALTLRANLQLSQAARLEIGNAYSGGTSLAPRNDPQVALAFHPAERLTVRLAAGSAYAGRPSDLSAAVPGSTAGAAPETSFGYRLRLDAALGAEDHAWFSAFALRRYDTFADLSDARALGVQVGIERTALASRLGGLAYLDLVRSAAFGSAQPAQRTFAPSFFYGGSRLGAVPYAKARVALTYRASSSELRLGTTLLGANNALATHAVALGDASLTFPFAHLIRLRVGMQNLFGTPVVDPALRPFYAPREFTLVVQPGFAK